MNLIRNEDDTFDLNLTETELAHIAIWSCLNGEHYRLYRDGALRGAYSDGIRQVVKVIDNQGNGRLKNMAQSETHRWLARELVRLVEEGDIDEYN